MRLHDQFPPDPRQPLSVAGMLRRTGEDTRVTDIEDGDLEITIIQIFPSWPAGRIVTTFVCQRNNANPASLIHISAATSAEGCA
jgi:hypothetical protein